MKDYPYSFLVRMGGGQRAFIRRAKKKLNCSEAGVVRVALMNLETTFKEKKI